MNLFHDLEYRITNLLQIDYKLITDWLQTDYRLITDWLQIDYKLITNWLQTDYTDYKLITNWLQTDWDQNVTKSNEKEQTVWTSKSSSWTT